MKSQNHIRFPLFECSLDPFFSERTVSGGRRVVNPAFAVSGDFRVSTGAFDDDGLRPTSRFAQLCASCDKRGLQGFPALRVPAPVPTPAESPIQCHADGTCDVLVAGEAGALMLMTGLTQVMASDLVSGLDVFLDLNAILNQHVQGQDIVDPVLKKAFEEDVAVQRVYRRLKSPESLKNKIFRLAREASVTGVKFGLADLYDVLGYTIVVSDVQSVDRVILRLEQLFGGLTQRQKAINPQKPSSCYFVRYVRVRLFTGQLVELKVKTALQEALTEWNHQHIYKPRRHYDGELFCRLNKYDDALVDLLRAAESDAPVTGDLDFPDYREFGLAPDEAFCPNKTVRKILSETNLLFSVDQP